MNVEDARARLDRHRHRRRRPPALTRRELISIVDDLLELAVDLIEDLIHCHSNPNPRRSIIVQVAIPENQKVQLHAVEENAEGEAIDRDSASIAWTTDRADVITIEPGDDAFGVFAVPVGGAFGDTTVTATVTEPDVDDGQGGTTPGAVYVGTQVVTVNEDETIASVEITADQPVSR